MNGEGVFKPATEKDVTRAIIGGYLEQLDRWVESDCLIIGAGPAGLTAAWRLAREGVRTLIIERNNYLGGGFWIGGYLMNKVTVRAPAHEVLRELGVPLEKYRPGLFVADGPHACAKLIAAALDAGARVLNMTSFEDLVLREGNRVAGAVVNWTPVQALPRQITCVDPVAIESKIVVDATGHDAVVANSIEERGLIAMKGYGNMWVERSEDAVVENTKEIYPGLIVTGMAVATVFGLPRMGPTFGGMLLSGKRVTEVALEKLKELEGSQ